jgi:hypothetical protein
MNYPRLSAFQNKLADVQRYPAISLKPFSAHFPSLTLHHNYRLRLQDVLIA